METAARLSKLQKLKNEAFYNGVSRQESQ